MDGRTCRRCWTVQEQGGMLGCELTHITAKDAMHYDRKPIRADQCSATGDDVRADAIPLSHPEVSDGCQCFGAQARARNSLAMDEPSCRKGEGKYRAVNQPGGCKR